MIFKKLDTGDVLRNTLKVYPKNSVFIDVSGSQYIKSLNQQVAWNVKNSYLAAGSLFNLPSSGSVSITPANSSVGFLNPPGLSQVQIYDLSYTKDYTIPAKLSSSIVAIQITSSDASTYKDITSNSGIYEKYKINALKNTLDWNRYLSDSFNSENYLNSDNSIKKRLTLLNIPSVFYGNTIKKGSILINFYITGTLIGSLSDATLTGELLQTYPVDSNYTNSAGVILYDEGIIILTGSWNITNEVKDTYLYESSSLGLSYSYPNNLDNPKWLYFYNTFLSGCASSSFELNFEGTDYINTITIFAHAEKNEFNGTSNLTAYKHSKISGSNYYTSSVVFSENPRIEMANTVKTSYETISGSYRKQTFINKIGIYDENQKLIAIAKLATPIKKNTDRDYTFKLKLDI